VSVPLVKETLMADTRPHSYRTQCHLTLTGEIDMANAEDYLALAQAIIAGTAQIRCSPSTCPV
jgi:hypothetical protein